MSPLIDNKPPMARPSMKLNKSIKSTNKTIKVTKQMQGQPSKNKVSKHAKKNRT